MGDVAPSWNGSYDHREFYAALGLKSGLEIHQQLKTEKKLFCRCPTRLRKDAPDAEILRHMRPTLSEMGTYDGTALMEFKTKKQVTYQLYNDSVCTYEMDDTPPFELNRHALDIALEISMLLGSSIVDELHISRKQYLDGSIPGGFQRTAIVGVEGEVPFEDGEIGIIQLSLEEDSCREMEDKGHNITFKTDRLSIPLVEVVTHAHMHTPQDVEKVARLLGRLMRSTGKVRRGLGATRQDVNVSIAGGRRVEIKGVARLQWIPKLVHNEALRQKALLEIMEELGRRGVGMESLESEIGDITALLTETSCPPIRAALDDNNVVMGIKLSGFGGLLNRDTQPGMPFSQDFVGRVRVIACLDKMPNLLHTDEAPCGITDDEMGAILANFKASADKDVVVLVWGNREDAETAAQEVMLRAKDACCGVPNETRQAFLDGTTDFERILPGPDRMYPDTDSPPTTITEGYMNALMEGLPEHLWKREDRLRNMGLPEPVVLRLSISRYADLFDGAARMGMEAMFSAVLLTEKLTALGRKGVDTESIPLETFSDIFKLIADGKMCKDAAIQVIEHLSQNSDLSVYDALRKLDLEPLSRSWVERTIDEVISHNPGLEDGNIHSVMGKVMEKIRGRFNGRQVYEIVKKRLENN